MSYTTILTAMGPIVTGAVAIFAWIQPITAIGAREGHPEARDALDAGVRAPAEADKVKNGI